MISWVKKELETRGRMSEFIFGGGGYFKLQSHSFGTITGRSDSEFIGKTWSNFMF